MVKTSMAIIILNLKIIKYFKKVGGEHFTFLLECVVFEENDTSFQVL